MIGVPFARAISPVTKTNWEGVGVEPDVKVKREIAFETAYKAILENRLSSAPSPAAKAVMEQEIAGLAKEIEAKR